MITIIIMMMIITIITIINNNNNNCSSSSSSSSSNNVWGPLDVSQDIDMWFAACEWSNKCSCNESMRVGPALTSSLFPGWPMGIASPGTSFPLTWAKAPPPGAANPTCPGGPTGAPWGASSGGTCCACCISLAAIFCFLISISRITSRKFRCNMYNVE